MTTIDTIANVSLRYTHIGHKDKNRREQELIAVNELVSAYFGHDATIGHDKEGAPFITGRCENISISHSAEYAVLAVASPHMTVGVDVENYRMQLQRVAPRVLSDSELEIYGKSARMLLKAWVMKEAVYKAAAIPGLIFASEINLPLHTDERTVVNVRGRLFECNFLDIDDNTIICTATSII